MLREKKKARGLYTLKKLIWEIKNLNELKRNYEIQISDVFSSASLSLHHTV